MQVITGGNYRHTMPPPGNAPWRGTGGPTIPDRKRGDVAELRHDETGVPGGPVVRARA